VWIAVIDKLIVSYLAQLIWSLHRYYNFFSISFIITRYNYTPMYTQSLPYLFSFPWFFPALIAWYYCISVFIPSFWFCNWLRVVKPPNKQEIKWTIIVIAV